MSIIKSKLTVDDEMRQPLLGIEEEKKSPFLRAETISPFRVTPAQLGDQSPRKGGFGDLKV